jgi:hypothetical protein
MSEFVEAQAVAFRALAQLRASGASGEADSPPAGKALRSNARAQRLAFELGFDSCTLV